MAVAHKVMLTPTRVPSATYRLQFHGGFRLQDARGIVDYLAALAASDVYASPLFRARELSSHGYDVVDHGTIDPGIGTEADLQGFAEQLRGCGLGLMLDVVPNHMGIDDAHNVWWQDVLENGPSSPYAKFFDIDWRPPKAALADRVLLPFLGDQYGKVLENQELTLAYDGERFLIQYYDRRFPVSPQSWRTILQVVLERVRPEMAADDPQRMELESIITALENLPPATERDPERLQQRQREKEVIRRRLATIYALSPVIHEALDWAVVEFNGQRGDPHSFDRLEALLAEQPYRLCYWRVASDEINYRRFFDINALAAIRVEDPDVFQAVHAMVFRFLQRGWATELRIDHPDGLLDPHQYFSDVQRLYCEAADADGRCEDTAGRPALYLAVEKILARDEQLPADWQVAGTTGYDFLNLVNGLFVDRRGAYALRKVYARFTGETIAFADVLYQSKQTILSFSMSSELYVLASQLDRISEQHRWSRDFTRSALHRALREVIACFPVYRTYIRPTSEEVSPQDRSQILRAIRAAKRRNPAMSPAFFDFIASVLLLDYPDSLSAEDRHERLQFVLKFQQVTGPVMAKGLEDTAFYRWYPLASLNEVGGDPAMPGVTPDEFHRNTAERMAAWPHSMLATATHDTKRGEDVRARLNVLSEIPAEWEEAIQRWQIQNVPHRGEIDGAPVPDANEEYLLYQTLVGTWPLGDCPNTLTRSASEGTTDAAGELRPGSPSLALRVGVDTPASWDSYVARIVAYMDKALKEAKLHTSWSNPDEQYDQAVAAFVRQVLDQDASAEFLADMDAFVRSIADAGWLNSLAQCVLKICSPGVPDFYQGTELWDFHLVDPDNRTPVDFVRRRELLAELQRSASTDLPGLVAELLAQWPDERLKLFLTWRALNFRRKHMDLFSQGNYTPLPAEGPRAEHVCAFAREHDGDWATVIVPRLAAAAFHPAANSAATPLFGRGGFFATWWAGTTILLPPHAPSRWCNTISGLELTADGRALGLERVFQQFPVAVLEGQDRLHPREL